MKTCKEEDLKKIFGLSTDYVNSLTEQEKEMYEVIRPVRKSKYIIDVSFGMIDYKIEDLISEAKTMGGELILNPDFQRGHVWSQEKQIGFIENFLKKTAPNTLKFNCPDYFEDKKVKDLNSGDIVCIDGLQRLTAMRDFMAGKFKVFEKYYAKDLAGTSFDPKRYTFKLEMFDISSKKELIRFYLDINTGGVVHSDEEIKRVSNMMNNL